MYSDMLTHGSITTDCLANILHYQYETILCGIFSASPDAKKLKKKKSKKNKKEKFVWLILLLFVVVQLCLKNTSCVLLLLASSHSSFLNPDR